MISPNDLTSPLTEEEYEELDQFLLSLDYEEGILCISELDGFFTAVVSGPELITPAEWLPLIWGDDEHSPEWESEADFQRIFGLLIRHMNSTADMLMDAPMEFEPCFLESTDEGQCHTIVDNWCEGYMKAVALHPERWAEMPHADTDYLAPLLMFTTDEGFAQLESMTNEEIEFWQQEIAPAALRIHAYWLAQGGRSATPRFHPMLLPTTAAND